MANLMPVRESLSLRDAMDRLFEQSIVRPLAGAALTDNVSALALDVLEKDEDVTVRASIPGVDPEAIDISITGDILSIKGETREEKEQARGNYHLRERRYGAFQRAIRLPERVDADAAEAEFENGVLTLTLPKVEEAKPKKVEVQAA